LGALSTYAKRMFEKICNDVESDAISYCQKLYPEFGPNMMLTALKAEFKGQQKRIVSRLCKGKYQVDAKHFSNTGKLRAIAQSFYFALLKKQNGGLNFIVLDDPILSFDDEHRERWTDELLVHEMEKKQIILATHQKGYIDNNSKTITEIGESRYFHMISRGTNKKITIIPGPLLEQAEIKIKECDSQSGNVMRKYVEEVMVCLNAYSPEHFYGSTLRSAIDNYLAFKKPHPLASKNQGIIGNSFLSEKVRRVINPDSHFPTQQNVSDPMRKDCFDELKSCDRNVTEEIKRLEKLRRHRIKRIGTTTLIPFPDPTNMSWNEFSIPLVGSAAAQSNGTTIDFTQQEQTQLSIPEGTPVLVTGDTLDPVARRGQWILLAPQGTKIENGDLVAVNADENKKLLRRLWYYDDQQFQLESINPVKPIPSVIGRESTNLFRRVIGVIYEPIQFRNTENGNEWSPDCRFNLDDFRKMNAVQIKGNSSEPIARNGQYVLLKDEMSPDEVKDGTDDLLAVADTGEDGSGTVVKRVHRNGDMFTLVSLNPVGPHPILVFEKKDIRKILPVMGVLFEA
ncbi:MAG: hypothetical protein J7M30_15345, partial [Deltaproteobacteria bacterium]|nr:hypothetical protein [Deltaproteobacteria bacterium]